MAINANFAGMDWLKPADTRPGGSLGSALASIATSLIGNGASVDSPVELSENERRSKIAATQLDGLTGYEEDLKQGLKPEEAIQKHGAKMFFGSNAFPNFVSREQALQGAYDRKIADVDGANTRKMAEISAAMERMEKKGEFDKTIAEIRAAGKAGAKPPQEFIIRQATTLARQTGMSLEDAAAQVSSLYEGTPMPPTKDEMTSKIEDEIRNLDSDIGELQVDLRKNPDKWFWDFGDDNRQVKIKELTSQKERLQGGGQSKEFDSIEDAKKAGHKSGDIIKMWNPDRKKYQRFQLD